MTDTTNWMVPDRGKPQNHREYVQPCSLHSHFWTHNIRAMVQNIKIRTNCTWFMAAQLKHIILWSGKHLLVFYRDFSHVYNDGSSSDCLMGGEESWYEWYSYCLTGLGILLNPKELKIFYNLPNIYVLHVSHCILFKNSLVREKLFTPIPQYGVIVIWIHPYLKKAHDDQDFESHWNLVETMEKHLWVSKHLGISSTS